MDSTRRRSTTQHLTAWVDAVSARSRTRNGRPSPKALTFSRVALAALEQTYGQRPVSGSGTLCHGDGAGLKNGATAAVRSAAALLRRAAA